jgi:toxin ParE1/3/4
VSVKPVIPREQARSDVAGAVEFYGREAGARTALRFIDALERTYQAIGRNPGAGSPRHGHELGLPGVRARLAGRFPYLIFYVEQHDHVDVWRVLHAQRDIPTWLQPPTG